MNTSRASERVMTPNMWRRIDSAQSRGTTPTGLPIARMTVSKVAPPILFFQCRCGESTCARHVDSETLAGWGGYEWPATPVDGETVQAVCWRCTHEAKKVGRAK